MPIRGVSTKTVVLLFPACATDSITSSGFTSCPATPERSTSGSPDFSISAFISTNTTRSKGFTKKYQCHRLVYYESFQDVSAAIAREKQIKGWRREKKIGLIEKLNPRWQDLAENWGRELRLPGQSIVETP